MALPTQNPADLPRSPFSAFSPIASASLARDIASEQDESEHVNQLEVSDFLERAFTNTHRYSMSQSYRVPNMLASHIARPSLHDSFTRNPRLSSREQAQLLEEERDLLVDSFLYAPRRHSRTSNHDSERSGSRSGMISALRRGSASQRYDETDVAVIEEGEETDMLVRASSRRSSRVKSASENTPLLGGGGGGGPTAPLSPPESDYSSIDRKFEEAALEGLIHTTMKRELKTIGGYALPLILTFLLQYSLSLCSIFTLGHWGTIELGAASVASMTTNITGLAIYQGLSTSLDTLCPQAFGSGHKKLVGLNCLRMAYFLFSISIPIAAVWFSGEAILLRIVPEVQTAVLAGSYLRIAVIGMPGVILFESFKRFLQAQGLFSATLYVLLIVAPFNAFMHWFLVFNRNLGFVGAPIALVITQDLQPVLLLLYVYFIAGRECWGGFSRTALKNWGPMIRLSIPGLAMILAGYLAFEILTLLASYMGSTHLAAQSVLTSICALAFQVPFPISIASSTRIANLIGAKLAPAAKTAAKTAMCIAFVSGLCNMTILLTLRNYIPRLFTNDAEVVQLVADVLPYCAAFQLFDSLAANCGGIMRGIGLQYIGGPVNLVCYYLVALPLSLYLGFNRDMKLTGIWIGPALGLFLIMTIQGFFIIRANWDQAVEDAKTRNERE